MGNVSATRRKHSSKDLEKYCKPTGLYETCPWEERVVRRWILEGDVAPRYPGSDAPGYVTSGDGLNNVVEGIGAIGRGTTMSRAGSVGSFSGRSGGGMDIGWSGRVAGENQEIHSESRHKQVVHTEECPICFMHYQGVNHTVCCSKPLCTECYLQVRPPRTSVVCPFCNCSKFSVEYLGPPSKEDSERLLAEEQRTIEARIRAEQEANLRQMEERRKRENAAVETTASAGGAATAMTASADASAGGVSSRAVIPPAPKVVLSTVAERRMTEMQIRNQHIRQPRDSIRRSGPRRGSRLVHRQASVDSDSSNDFQNHSDVRGESTLEGEIQQVEDLMLMEALRLSVLEEQARRERSGDMRRAASAAMSSSAGWGGSGGEGASTSSRVMGEIARISANYWDRLPSAATPPTSAPTIAAPTSSSSFAAAPTIPTANRSAGEPAPPSTTTTTSVSASVAPSSSSSGDDPFDLFTDGGLSRWVDVRRNQADLMEGRRGSVGTTGGGSHSGVGGRVSGTGTSRATEEASEAGEPQTPEAFMQSFRATLERSPTERETEGFASAGGGALGPYARAAAAAAPPPEQTSTRTSLTTPAVEDPIGSIIRTIRSQDVRLGRAPDRTASMRGAGGNNRSGFSSGLAGSMQRGGGRLRSEEFGAAEGYLPQLPESEDEQLKLAIALSLRTSGGEKGGQGGEVKVEDGLEREVTAARSSSTRQLFRVDGAESSASGKERAPSVVDREQEEKCSENDPVVSAGSFATGDAASTVEPASRSEAGHEEVVRKLSAPASEDSSETKSPDPDANKGSGGDGGPSCDLFEAAAEDLAFFAAAATGRSHSDAWSPSQQRRSGRFPFSSVFSLDEEEKEGEAKASGGGGADGGGDSRLRSTEEQELTVLEAGGGEEVVDGEPLVEMKSESIPAEVEDDCGVSSGGVANAPSGDSSGTGGIVDGVSSVPTAADAGHRASPASTSEGTNTVSSALIGGSGGEEPMSVDATTAVGEASGADSSSVPSPGLETEGGVNTEDGATAAVEERGETRAQVVSEEVEETKDSNDSSTSEDRLR